MNLQIEIDLQRQQINTDSYNMSIGEIVSVYQNNEMDLHPEFQRFYRWTDQQKSNLIESILLGIPIPPIFVSQRKDGVWDVIDGLQRLSTILQFLGLLKDEEGGLVAPLVLNKTRYLPALEGMVWENWKDAYAENKVFDPAQRLLIKRSKLGVTIILRESDEKSKYELFQRLNTGGTQLSDQEVRNCILVMVNRDFYKWLLNLSQNREFLTCLPLTDRAIEEKYDMELALRFVILRKLNEAELKDIGDIGEFLSEKAIELASDKNFDYAKEEAAFLYVFQTLAKTLGSESFRKFDIDRGKFLGGFSAAAFELVAVGIGTSFEANPAKPIDDLEKKIKDVWTNPDFLRNSGSGVRANQRLPRVVPLGRQIFSE